MRNDQRQAGRVDELDGLRGVLSLWVAVSHILCWCGFWSVTLPRPFGRVLSGFVQDASSGVSVFLILSGFAISFLLHHRRQSYRDFMTGRFFRIYPVYLVCLILGAATSLLIPFIVATASWRETIYFEWVNAIWTSERASTSSHIFWHLTLLNGLIPKQMLPDSSGTLLTPAWSISLEWQFYLMAPLIVRLARSGIGLLALTAVAWLGLRYAHAWENPFLAFLPTQLPLFLIGIGSYHLYAWYCASENRGSRNVSVPIAALLALAVISWWHPVALTLWALAFGCVFVSGNDAFGRALSVLRSTLLHPWLQRLGKISYPLYLIHWPLIIAFLFLLLRWQPGLTSLQAGFVMIGIGLPLILIGAEVLHRTVERPWMTFGKRLLDRPKESKITRNALEAAT